MADQRGRAAGCGGCAAVCGGGNRGPAFTEAKIQNLLTIMGDAVPISPMDWGVVAEHHKELFGAKNRDVTSL
jgi:hypothetical protein